MTNEPALFEDNKDLLAEIMSFSDEGIDMDNQLLVVLLANKLIDKMTSINPETLRILGYSTKRTKKKIDKINTLSNVFGNPKLLERFRADWLLSELTYKGKSREDIISILKILAQMNGQMGIEEDEPRGFMARMFNR